MWSAWPFKEWYLKKKISKSQVILQEHNKNPHLKADSFYLVKVPNVYLVEDRTRWNHTFPACRKFWCFRNLLCIPSESQSMYILYWYILAPPAEVKAAPKNLWLIWRPSSDYPLLIFPASSFPIGRPFRELHGIVRNQSSLEWAGKPHLGDECLRFPVFFKNSVQMQYRLQHSEKRVSFQIVLQL